MKDKVKLSANENEIILNIPIDLINIPKEFLSKKQIKNDKMLDELGKRIKKLEVKQK